MMSARSWTSSMMTGVRPPVTIAEMSGDRAITIPRPAGSIPFISDFKLFRKRNEDFHFRGGTLSYGRHRNRDSSFTIKVVVHQFLRAAIPLFSLLSILSGYYLIWRLSPDSLLTEVIARTRAGIILTIMGGVTLMIWMHRILK